MSIRFTDILTTATALAHYLGDSEITTFHLTEAVALLRAQRTLEDYGPGRSPMIPRDPGGAMVGPQLRDLTQAWFKRMGSNPTTELEDRAVEEFLDDLRALDSAGTETAESADE